jgi:hypothetical protein
MNPNRIAPTIDVTVACLANGQVTDSVAAELDAGSARTGVAAMKVSKRFT